MQDSKTQLSGYILGRIHRMLALPLLLYRVIVNGFPPTTHKISLQTSKVIILPKTKASCYSHHSSQSALCETNWLFRVSGCNPYLNPYLIIYIEAPLLCRAIANGFHPATYKVSLQTSKAIIMPKTSASYYSHHSSQSALRETN